MDELRRIAAGAELSVAQLVLRWSIYRPGITAVLVGATRVEQVRENAGGMGPSLAEDTLGAIDRALASRGVA